MLRYFTVITLALFLVPATGAGTYKWVDKDGNVHYSDKPVEGAEEVELPETMTFDAPEVAPRPVRPPDDGESSQEEAGYARLAFVSPKQDQVFWNTGGTIPVQLDLEPRLRPGDVIRLFFNGDPIEMQGLGTTLTEVYRGAYTVRAAVIGPDGKEVVSTGPVTFHVKQHSIANPQRPGRR